MRIHIKEPDDALATSIVQHGHFHSFQDVVTHSVVCIQILQVGQEHAMIGRLLITNSSKCHFLRFIMCEQEEENIVELLECGLAVIRGKAFDYVFHLLVHIKTSDRPLQALLNATVHKRQNSLRFCRHCLVLVVVAMCEGIQAQITKRPP